MEITRGRGSFPAVMARVEVLSDMKQEREIDIRGLRPLENFFRPHALNIRETPCWR